MVLQTRIEKCGKPEQLTCQSLIQLQAVHCFRKASWIRESQKAALKRYLVQSQKLQAARQFQFYQKCKSVQSARRECLHKTEPCMEALHCETVKIQSRQLNQKKFLDLSSSVEEVSSKALRIGKIAVLNIRIADQPWAPA